MPSRAQNSNQNKLAFIKVKGNIFLKEQVKEMKEPATNWEKIFTRDAWQGPWACMRLFKIQTENKQPKHEKNKKNSIKCLHRTVYQKEYMN